MKLIKCLTKSLLGLTLALSLPILGARDAFAGGKGAWAILTDPQVRWVEYPGSDGKLLYDRETGLIWEQHPDAFIPDYWGEAASYCLNRSYTVNGKLVHGFRLPAAAELSNLGRDVFTAFDNVQGSTHTLGIHFDNFYVSSELVHIDFTSSVINPNSGFWGVSFIFNNGQVNPFVQLLATEGPGTAGDSQEGHSYRVMCVRGGGGNHAGHEQSPF